MVPIPTHTSKDAKNETYSASFDTILHAERSYRVVCIGGGFSDIGGTWFEDRYPGCACDVPSQIYTYTFEPNWTHFYAGAEEIHGSCHHVAEKYGVHKYVKLSHEVQYAAWDETNGKWQLKVREVATGRVFDDSCNMLVNASGLLNDWKWPTIKGLHDFKGKLLHSARWDQSYDWTGQKVALIGSGSSCIQILPQIQPASAHVDYYARSSAWISPPFASSKNGFDASTSGGNPAYTAGQIAKWKADPESHHQYRKEIKDEFNRLWDVLIEDTDGQRSYRKICEDLMNDRLKSKPKLKYLIPDWGVGCRRLTPGLGYLETLTEENVNVIRNEIVKITENGIITDDGVEHQVDAIICATGFDVSFKPRFPLIGRNE